MDSKHLTENPGATADLTNDLRAFGPVFIVRTSAAQSHCTADLSRNISLELDCDFLGTQSPPIRCDNKEEKVGAVVKKLKERGLVSPYLRSFVVARINPLRWIKCEPPPLEDVLKTMRERVAKFNVEKIRPQDLAGAAGPPDDEI
jgi:hypothetical protein